MGIIEQELQKADDEQLYMKKILLMGRIEHVKEMADWLQKRDMLVEAILDNDRKKQGLSVNGVPILAPEQVLLPFREDVFILIYSPKYWEDMCGQFFSYGYREGKHIHVLDRPGREKNIGRVKEGIQLYYKLQTQYGKDTSIFLANCPLGDYYLLGLYFHQYCVKNQIDHYVMIGESRGIDKLSAALGIKYTQTITTDESNALIRAWIFLGEDLIHIKPLTLWQGAFRFNPCQVRQRDQFSFMDTFTKMIYGLDLPVPKYPDFCTDMDKVQEFFKINNLRPQKTVLLSPFSYSLQPLPEKFWIALTADLKECGYTVVVNVGEEREHNFIADTTTLHADFFNTIGVMEYGGTVIGMRSGFFDITARAKCRRFVLYPASVKEQTTWNSTNIRFCSLKRMGLCEDAREWEVTDMEEIRRKILLTLQEGSKWDRRGEIL